MIGVGAGGRELLCKTLGDGRVGRGHGDRGQAAAVTVSVSAGLVTPPRVAVIFVVPVASDWARPAAADAGDGGRGRRPGHLRRQVGGRPVGVGAGGRELLRKTLGDGRVGRNHGDRGQAAAVTVRCQPGWSRRPGLR